MSKHPLIGKVFLWAVLSLMLCVLLNPGNFGTIDTTRRLQVARWIWRGEPPVVPGETSFGLIGRDGTRQAWYGIGQSLVLVPFDALVRTAVMPRLQHYGLNVEKQQQIAVVLIAFLMQWVIATGVLTLAYEILRTFSLSQAESLAGTVALLFGTTFLQYIQSAQENNLLLLLVMLALYGIQRWRQTGRPAWAVLSGAACGFAILVRLTSVLETAVFAGLICVLPRNSAVTGGAGRALRNFAPPVIVALLLDRWYQWHRFGEFFSTYIGVFGRQAQPTDAPDSFPFSYPFLNGFWGAFFSPDKSIFLFDPLLVVLLMVVVLVWQKIERTLRTAILSFLVLLLLYIGTYATYFDFGGDVAWGHRFVTLPVQLLCLFSVPLLLRFAYTLTAVVRRAAWALVIGSVMLQAASTAVAPNLEVLQREMGYSHGVIVNRGLNLLDLAEDREIRGSDRIPAEWRSLYYFPFQLRFRFPGLAKPAIALWIVTLACLLIATLILVMKIRTEVRLPVGKN
jgi:hypothetical protein